MEKNLSKSIQKKTIMSRATIFVGYTTYFHFKLPKYMKSEEVWVKDSTDHYTGHKYFAHIDHDTIEIYDRNDKLVYKKSCWDKEVEPDYGSPDEIGINDLTDDDEDEVEVIEENIPDEED